MTRLNVVPVSELTQPEIAGEWKEYPRLFTLVRNRAAKGHTPQTMIKEIPTSYTLGKGHVKFFYDKIAYAVQRYTDLCNEMLERGYNPNLEMFNDIIDSCESSIPSCWWNDYTPTPEAIALNIQRMIDNGTR